MFYVVNYPYTSRLNAYRPYRDVEGVYACSSSNSSRSIPWRSFINALVTV